MAEFSKDTKSENLLINLRALILTGDLNALSRCPASQMETLEEAAMVHGIDCGLLVEKINAAAKAMGK